MGGGEAMIYVTPFFIQAEKKSPPTPSLWIGPEMRCAS